MLCLLWPIIGTGQLRKHFWDLLIQSGELSFHGESWFSFLFHLGPTETFVGPTKNNLRLWSTEETFLGPSNPVWQLSFLWWALILLCFQFGSHLVIFWFLLEPILGTGQLREHFWGLLIQYYIFPFHGEPWFCFVSKFQLTGDRQNDSMTYGQ